MKTIRCVSVYESMVADKIDRISIYFLCFLFLCGIFLSCLSYCAVNPQIQHPIVSNGLEEILWHKGTNSDSQQFSNMRESLDALSYDILLSCLSFCVVHSQFQHPIVWKEQYGLEGILWKKGTNSDSRQFRYKSESWGNSETEIDITMEKHRIAFDDIWLSQLRLGRKIERNRYAKRNRRSKARSGMERTEKKTAHSSSSCQPSNAAYLLFFILIASFLSAANAEHMIIMSLSVNGMGRAIPILVPSLILLLKLFTTEGMLWELAEWPAFVLEIQEVLLRRSKAQRADLDETGSPAYRIMKWNGLKIKSVAKKGDSYGGVGFIYSRRMELRISRHAKRNRRSKVRSGIERTERKTALSSSSCQPSREAYPLFFTLIASSTSIANAEQTIIMSLYVSGMCRAMPILVPWLISLLKLVTTEGMLWGLVEWPDLVLAIQELLWRRPKAQRADLDEAGSPVYRTMKWNGLKIKSVTKKGDSYGGIGFIYPSKMESRVSRYAKRDRRSKTRRGMERTDWRTAHSSSSCQPSREAYPLFFYLDCFFSEHCECRTDYKYVIECKRNVSSNVNSGAMANLVA